MVLEQDVAFLVVAEVRPILVLAVGHKSVPLLVVPLIFNEFHSIEPMLDVVAFDFNHRRIPGRDVERLVRRGRDKVVKRAKGPIALDPEFGVRMTKVVKDLELATYSGACAFIQGRVHKILDSAVSSLSDLEIDLENEVLVQAGGDDVASVGRLAAVPFENFQYPLVDNPPFGREIVKLGTSPAFSGLTIPK